MSPRALRRLLADLQEVVAPQVSEIEGGRRAQAVADWYAKAEPEERRDMWLLMCEQFAPDATRFKSARQRYEAAAGTAEEGQAEIACAVRWYRRARGCCSGFRHSPRACGFW